MATGLIPYWFNQVNNAGNTLMSLLSMPQQVNQVSNMTGMEPEFVPGAGQGPGPLSISAATKYGQDLARFGKGAVTGTLGAPGDIESLGRGAVSAFSRPPGQNMVNAFLSGMNQPTLMPTSSDVNKAINPYMPSFMAGEATAPQQIGEFVSLGGLINQVARRAPSVARGAEPLIDMVQNAPVGLSVRPMQTPPVSGLGFYSAVEDAALNLQRNSGAGQAFLNDIKKGANVKDEEIKWLGLDEFLAGKKNVTKQEVQDYIANNRVDVQEVALGGGADVREKADIDYSEGRLTRDEYNQILASSGAPSKFGSYTLPGGENYREILLTMPFKEPAMPKGYKVTSVQYDDGTSRYFAETPTTRSAAYKTEEDAKAELQRMVTGLKGFREDLNAFKSSHWDQPNVLAHLRVNDRVDADGKKMLLVEEVQSDWHQAGRDKGYATADINTRLKKSEKEVEQIGLQIRDLNNRMASLSDSQIDEFNKLADERQKLYDRQGFLMDEGNALIDKRNAGVPDAPFKDTWYQLALKRALQYAAENGYDRVGLTTGARQAERYDLSKQIKTLIYGQPDENGLRRVEAITPSGDRLLGKKYTEDEIAQNVGKEIAEKIIKNTGEFDKRTNTYAMTGLDLQVGGEGMKKYYDEVYPKFLSKYGKKWDAKMGETQIKVDADNERVRYIDITPKMRESVKGGQPLFSAAAPIGVGAAAGQEENRQSLMNYLGF